jgi:hypothetical protein
MTRYGTIIGTGRYVPEAVHTNDMLKAQVSPNPDLAKVVDAFEEQLRHPRPPAGPARVGRVGPRGAGRAGRAGQGRHHAPTRWT